MSTTISLTSTDFDTIKAALIEYMRGQNEFTDFDFTGSGISTILDLLSYNTSMQAYYLNMIANENFIGTAKVRSSVVNIANQLGYTPASRRSSILNVDIGVRPPNSPTSLTVPKGTTFKTVLGTSSYTFNVVEDITIEPDSNGLYTAENVELKEGTYADFSYIVDTTQTTQRFEIPNTNVDTNTLTVTIQESEEDTTSTVYTKASLISNLVSTSTVYFLEENENGKFEVAFGDGVVGKKLSNGNVIKLEYIVTNGKDANGAGGNSQTVSLNTGVATYKISDTTFTSAKVDATVNLKSAGGADKESTESVRFRAPKQYESQNRLVTADDYNNQIKSNYPEIDVVSVWGGEDNDPVMLGKVFISLKAKGGLIVTSQLEQDIYNNLIKDKKVVAIQTEFVEPIFTYISLINDVIYDKSETTKTDSTMETSVRSTIQSFSANSLETFGSKLRTSKLNKAILDAESSILNSTVKATLKQKIDPTLEQSADYTLYFQNPLYHPEDNYSLPVLSSTEFAYLADKEDDNSSSSSSELETDSSSCFLDDNGNGVLRIYYLDDGEKAYINNDAGTIDYVTGKVVLDDFRPISIVGTSLDITVTPAVSDISSLRNNLLIIDDADVNINITSE